MENKQEKRFSVMEDEKFIEFLTTQFGGIHERFDNMDARFDRLEARTENLEKSMVTKTYFDSQLKDIGERVDDLSGRLDRIEKRLGSNFKNIENIELELKLIRKKLDLKISEAEYTELEEKVSKIEKVAFAKIH